MIRAIGETAQALPVVLVLIVVVLILRQLLVMRRQRMYLVVELDDRLLGVDGTRR